MYGEVFVTLLLCPSNCCTVGVYTAYLLLDIWVHSLQWDLTEINASYAEKFFPHLVSHWDLFGWLVNHKTSITPSSSTPGVMEFHCSVVTTTTSCTKTVITLLRFGMTCMACFTVAMEYSNFSSVMLACGSWLFNSVGQWLSVCSWKSYWQASSQLLHDCSQALWVYSTAHDG